MGKAEAGVKMVVVDKMAGKVEMVESLVVNEVVK